MFILQAKDGGVHSIRPEHKTTLSGVDPAKAQALALIDLGVIDPDLAGHKIPFINYCINERLRLKVSDDGHWVINTEYGDIFEWADPFESGVEVFDEITPTLEAELIEVERVDERSAGIWFHIGGEPRWVQSDERPDSDYLFVGQMASYYSHTTTYAFYHPGKRELIFECQFT